MATGDYRHRRWFAYTAAYFLWMGFAFAFGCAKSWVWYGLDSPATKWQAAGAGTWLSLSFLFVLLHSDGDRQ